MWWWNAEVCDATELPKALVLVTYAVLQLVTEPAPSLRGTKQSVSQIAGYPKSEAQIASFLAMTFRVLN